jgi:hypothetical protein
MPTLVRLISLPICRWYALLIFAVAAATLGALVSPVITLAIGLLGASIWGATVAGSERRLGVGVLGAVAGATLIPPLYTALPPYTGMLVGGLWLAILALTARRPPGVTATFTLFAVVMTLGLATTMAAAPIPWLSDQVSLFTVMVGFFAQSLTPSEWRLVRLGIVFIATIEALICGVEVFVINATLSGSNEGGPHPLINGTVRAEGTLGHPLVAGMVMLVGLLLVVSLDLTIRWKTILMAVLGVGILACGSSSVYLTAMLCLTFHFLKSGSLAFRVAKYVTVTTAVFYLFFGSTILAPVTDDVSGVNSTHRLNSFIAFPHLLNDRSIQEGLLGSGWGSAEQNYQAGYLINDNFFAVDNQFTTVMMSAGLIGFIMFVAAVALALSQSDSSTRLAQFSMVFMFLSFDVLGWGATSALFIVLAVDRARPRPGRRDAELGGQNLGTVAAS